MTHLNDDGSWVIAVCDGLGGHDRGDEAAETAISTLPRRIAGEAEMAAAIQAANAAVWDLVAPDAHVLRKLGNRAYWPAKHEPQTTIAVAAWTSAEGLQTAWVGDSVLFFVPLDDSSPGVHSIPQGDWDSSIMDRSLGLLPGIEEDKIGRLDSHILSLLNRQIDNHGLLCIAATDGLFDPIRLARYGQRGRFSDDPADNSIGFAIPDTARTSAQETATALMNHALATRHGLHDNAAVAVAAARPCGESEPH